ncbi:hypothetical protein ACTFIW_011110 [Dictyostelium discoideum]
MTKSTFDDFKEIKKKYENNQLVYNRIVFDVNTFDRDYNYNYDYDILFEIQKYLSNYNSEFISNLFKILELNFFRFLMGYSPYSGHDESNKKWSEIYFNKLSIMGPGREILKTFKFFKCKHIIFEACDFPAHNGPNDIDDIFPTHVNYSALFDPDYSGQQVESIKVRNINEDDANYVEARHLIKVNQFENLHSIAIPINSFQILSNLLKEMGYFSIDCIKSDFGNSDNMKSELNQMINSLITSKSLKNLKISSINSIEDPIDYDACYDGGDLQTFIIKINEIKESFSNSFQPLFSELNKSIERIELDCCGLLNINTFSNLLKNKSIKYLYLYDSDFIIYSLKPTDDGSHDGNDNDDSDDDDDDDSAERQELHKETISINQYLFDNIFTSPLTSIRYYKIKLNELKELKFIFNLILNNIFKLQLYSLILVLNENELVSEFYKEFKNLINYISTQQQQQQQQQQQLNNINLKEINVVVFLEDNDYCDFLDEIDNNINFPYFTVITKIK